MTNIQSIHLDSAETMFFARELEYIKAQTYDKLYADLKAMRLLPVSSEAGQGAESITYHSFERVGVAKFIANYADDLPRADVKGREFTVPVRSIGASYGYSVQEIRAAQMAGRELNDRKSDAMTKSIEEKVDRLAWFGDEKYGLDGFLNNENVTRIAAADNAGQTSTNWDDKTTEEILEDMYEVVNTIMETTLGVEQPNTLLMPLKKYNKVASTRLSDASDTTILEYFKSNNAAGLQNVEWINEAAGAGVGIGDVNSGSDIMVAYDNNPNKLTLEIPLLFEQFEPQERNLEFVINGHARIAGMIIYYPLSVAVMEGI